jgi:hypothetical protein
MLGIELTSGTVLAIAPLIGLACYTLATGTVFQLSLKTTKIYLSTVSIPLFYIKEKEGEYGKIPSCKVSSCFEYMIDVSSDS